ERLLGFSRPPLMTDLKGFAVDKAWRRRARWGLLFPSPGFNLNDADGTRRFEFLLEPDGSGTARIGPQTAVAVGSAGFRFGVSGEALAVHGLIDVFAGDLGLWLFDGARERAVKTLLLASPGPDASEEIARDGATLLAIVEEPGRPPGDATPREAGRPLLLYGG